MRSVTLVCGPPAAGKTTWCGIHAESDAVVLDWDDFARAAGSTSRWNHSAAAAAEAHEGMARALDVVARADRGTFYVIRCMADATARMDLATELRADRTVVLVPPLAVLEGRARARSNPYRTLRGIRNWFRDYRPAPGDELIVAVPGSAARCSEEW